MNSFFVGTVVQIELCGKMFVGVVGSSNQYGYECNVVAWNATEASFENGEFLISDTATSAQSDRAIVKTSQVRVLRDAL